MTAYEKVMAARDANKLTSVDYIAHMFGDSFIELHGDSRYADDSDTHVFASSLKNWLFSKKGFLKMLPVIVTNISPNTSPKIKMLTQE